MRRLAVAVAILALLPAAACSDGGDDDAYVLELDGSAEVRSADEWRSLGSGDHQLAVGDEVRVTDGSGVVQLPGDGSVELRGGDAAVDDSRLELGAVPLLLDGDALVVAGDDVVQLAAGRANVAMRRGASRVRRSSSVTVAVYQGTADLEALGRELPSGLPAYRQVTVPETGALPRRPVPVVYDGDDPDPWDRRYLGEAIDLDDQFRVRARALERDLGPRARDGVDPELLRDVLPSLATQRGFSEELLDTRRSVSDTVVGASIVLGGSGDFVRRWRSTFDFRSAGAEWGLVALDQRARRESLLQALDGAVSAAFVATRPGGPVVGQVVAARPTAGGAAPSPPTTTQPQSPPPSSPPTTEPPEPGPSPSVPPTTVPPPPPDPVDPVESIVETLLGPSGDGTGGVIDEAGSLLGPG
jgi:hypothetical protein